MSASYIMNIYIYIYIYIFMIYCVRHTHKKIEYVQQIRNLVLYLIFQDVCCVFVFCTFSLYLERLKYPHLS